MFAQGKGERIALFVDGDNLYGTLTALGWQVDFIRLRDLLCADCQIYNCFYYTSWDEDQRKRSFAIFLLNQGFSVRKREIQKITKGDRIANIKGDTDVLMVMDLLLTMRNYDIAVLLTGDGDFVPVVEHLRLRGKRVVAVSSKFESASIELVNSVDRFIDLSEIKDFVQRVPRSNPLPPKGKAEDKKENNGSVDLDTDDDEQKEKDMSL